MVSATVAAGPATARRTGAAGADAERSQRYYAAVRQWLRRSASGGGGAGRSAESPYRPCAARQRTHRI